MTLPDDVLRELDDLLAPADAALAAGWPGEPAGSAAGAHALPAGRPGRRRRRDPGRRRGAGRGGRRGRRVDGADHRARPPRWSTRCGRGCWPSWRGEPVEDLRLDLEDGYGARPDDEEDRHARLAGEVLAALGGAGAPFVSGVRIKSLEAPTRRRGVRSLDLVLAAFGGAPPAGFVVTLPKVTSVDQVRAMVLLCERLEAAHGLPPSSLRFEVQVETPQAVLGADGTATVARAVHAAAGRCTGLHYGTYDYSASLGVAAAHQSMEHPVADHAKAVMQVAAAQTGVRVSDGSTNVLPLGDRAHVEAAWALHARLVRRSLERGIYQGWDLHPAQLPTRYLATFAFYREGLAAAVARLRGYLDRQSGGVLDEPATAFALAGFLVRGLDCGALDADEVAAAGGPDGDTLRRLARRDGAGSWLDALPAGELRAALLTVCASPRWADLVAAAAPYRSADGLLAAADRALAALDEHDVDDAMAGHPRIGERSAARGLAARAGRRRRRRDPRRAGRGQPRVREAVRPRLPGLRQRPQRRGAARRAALPARQRPGARAHRRAHRARQHQPAAAAASAGRRRTDPMSVVTTHVLDAVTGLPARGVAVRLEGRDLMVEARTDDDGRVRELGPDRLDPGTYRVVFATGDWFAAQGRETFYPEVVVTFTVDDPDGHLHVPLLLSPYAYSTYRGS